MKFLFLKWIFENLQKRFHFIFYFNFEWKWIKNILNSLEIFIWFQLILLINWLDSNFPKLMKKHRATILFYLFKWIFEDFQKGLFFFF